MKTRSFCPGITTLLAEHAGWIEGRRVGLVSHAAAVDRRGCSSAELLRHAPGATLTALFGPEHGYFGLAGAGEPTTHRRHPSWPIPIYSLYGENRCPTARSLKSVDVIVVDLQDLGARPYTYVSTLRCVLEAASECGKSVIVADRPVPLPRVIDGPALDPAYESFVGYVRTPMAYGMTPGEAALWIRQDLDLPVDVRVAAMNGYGRDPFRGRDWPPWIPPSPGIRSWESAYCFGATVFGEALPAIDHGRTTGLPFQLLGSPWMKSVPFCEAMTALRLPGVTFHPHPYAPPSGPFADRLLDGVRMTVTNPSAFRPVRLAVSIVAAFQRLYGRKRLWAFPGTRPAFFDKLFGTSRVREALLDGEDADAIARRWQPGLRSFQTARRKCIMYPAS